MSTSYLPILFAANARLRATLLLVVLALPFATGARAQAKPNVSVVTVFESRSPGNEVGGAMGIEPSFVSAYSFAITAPTHITELGARLSTLRSTDQSVYFALYKIDTPPSALDAVGDSDLLTTTLVTVPAQSDGVVSGPVSVTLQPGWYAVGIGTGRNGASAAHLAVQWPNLDSAASPGARLPYAVDVSTGVRELQNATPRVFVLGYALDNYPAASGYVMRSAQPWSTWLTEDNTAQDYTVDDQLRLAVRFELDQPQTVGRVAVWGWGGSGAIAAMIVHLASVDDMPPQFGSAAFFSALAGYTLIPVGGEFKNYAGDFGNLLLPPGAYALVIGSDVYGANGSVNAMTIASGDLLPGLTDVFQWSAALRPTHFELFGTRASFAASPSPAVFPTTAVGNSASKTVTVTNTSALPVAIGGLSVTGPAVGAFAVADTGTCADATLAGYDQCTVDVVFTPQQTGARYAVLRIVGSGDPTPLAVPLIGNGSALDVGVDDGSRYAAYGSAIEYTITVSNPSTSAVNGVSVAVPLPAALASGASWTCAGANGGSCVSAVGVGAIAESGLALPAGASVTFTLDATVLAGSDAPALRLEATATSDVPYAAADSDILVLFRNGFE